MGFFIEAATNKSKAQWLVKHRGAEIVDAPTDFSHVPPEKGLVVVVDNGMFEAAGYIFDQDEYRRATQEDGRSREFVLMDKELAEDLSGYSAFVRSK